MDILTISVFAFFASLLTFFSGFGLGTVLTPVFIIFFPPEIAIALTAIVHFLNNIFKLVLTYKGINKNTLLMFGIPSLFAALPGAWLLTYADELPLLYSYSVNGTVFSVSPLKLIIGLLIMVFALLESIPFLKNMKAGENAASLTAGGLLSGFFGGLSGHQGALRTIFLVKTGMAKENFIATGIAIACLVDVARLLVYSFEIPKGLPLAENMPVLSAAILSAFAGALIGNKLLKKTTLPALQKFIAAALILFALAMMAGIV